MIFFIHIHSRRTVLGGITPYPDEEWMKQTARNLTGFDGELINASHLIHDQDTKYTSSFDELFRSSGIEPLKLPVQSLNLNTYAERFVRSIREECLNRSILVGEKSLRKVISEYFEYYHHERNHQGKNNKILFPYSSHSNSSDKVILTTHKGNYLLLFRGQLFHTLDVLLDFGNRLENVLFDLFIGVILVLS